MRRKNHVRKAIILERQDTDVGVGRGGGEVAARLGGAPGDQVDGGGVQGELVDALPLVVLLAPDEDAAVVGGGGEDGAVFGVRPGDAPDGAFVAGRMD